MSVLSFLFNSNSGCQAELEYYPDAVILTSTKGEILEANKKACKIFSLPDFHSHQLIDLFEGGFNLVEDLVKTGSSSTIRSKLKMEEEQYIDIRASRYGEKGDTIVISIRDVSPMHRMLNKLVFEHEYLNKLTKEKNTFISKIGNELTSPLHSINGFSQAVLEGLSGEVNDKQTKYLRIINKNSAQLLETVEKMIEHSKLESGLYDYEFKSFDFVTMMTNIFDKYIKKAEDKKLVFNIDLNQISKRMCYNDENLIRRTVENLVDVAIKSTEKGHVQIVISIPDPEFLELSGFNVQPGVNDKAFLMFKISDTSQGLIESEKELMFNPYVDLDKIIARKELNKKLSMVITNQYIKLAKGKLWVESEPLKGTTYTLIIPAEKV